MQVNGIPVATQEKAPGRSYVSEFEARQEALSTQRVQEKTQITEKAKEYAPPPKRLEMSEDEIERRVNEKLKDRLKEIKIETQDNFGSEETDYLVLSDLLKPTSNLDRSAVEEVAKWARGEGAQSPQEILTVVRKKLNQLGSPRLGDSLLQHIHRWLVAHRGFMKAKEQLEEYGGA